MITYVGGAVASKPGSASGNSTISLTTLTGGSGSSAQAGDYVVAAFATGSNQDRNLTISDGTNNYPLIATELYNNETYDTNLRVGAKHMGSTPDSFVTFGPTGGTGEAGTMAVHVWRGVDSANPLDVAAVTATGFSAQPNGAAITPTTSGAVVLVIGAGSPSTFTGSELGASELSNFIQTSYNDSYDSVLGIGSYAWASGIYDPEQWTGSPYTGGSWAAITVALRPDINQTLSQSSRFDNAQTWYQHAIGLNLLQSARFDNQNTFYGHSIAAALIQSARFDNVNTFFEHTLTPGPVTLSQDAMFVNEQTWYEHELTSEITLSQTERFDNVNIFYDHGFKYYAKWARIARSDQPASLASAGKYAGLTRTDNYSEIH